MFSSVLLVLLGMDGCTVCAVGTYQDETGQAVCDSCAAGTYQDSTGQTSCKSCDVGVA